MLQVDGLEHHYGGSQTLWGATVEVTRGSCTCLMGRNGVGKTTLLKCVMGLEPVSAGRIVLDEVPIERAPIAVRARSGVGYVPQGREIFPRLTVEENLLVGLGARGRGAVIPPRVLDLFPVLRQMLGRRGGDLSGGQQQQLAIGRALVLEPRLLILDEPTEGIQPSIVREIADVIVALNRDLGLTVLLVEQKLPFVRRVADRFVIMDKGRDVAAGPIDALDDALVRRHLTV
ncbi:MAG: urea ABC transporter ATP-binding subunit UrtE [Ectothiorhodospiraceae bacterium]|nr:urea ABC transporter ATP-binding subunit UrtE [Ectothiorhodospiraceae bacterium]